MSPSIASGLRSYLPGLALLALFACQSPKPADMRQENHGAGSEPPVAKVVPEKLEAHGHVRVDDYYWLRGREDPEVIAYLEAENAYMKAETAHTKELQEELFEELKGRIKQDDSSVPYLYQGYWYYTRYEEGKQYPIHCRRKGSMEAEEHVLLDVNKMAEGHGYYSVGGRALSPAQDRIAYGVDDQGRRIYTIEVRDLATDRVLDRIPGVTSNVVWSGHPEYLFYTKRDPETLRAYQVYRHRVGTDPSEDKLVFEETDETFSCGVSKTRSRRFITIRSSHTLADEVRVVDAESPTDTFRVVLPRERGHEYRLDHHGDHFYIVSNDGAPNFKLMRTSVDAPSRGTWEEVIPHRADVLLQSVSPFRDHLVINERREGLVRLRIRSLKNGKEHEMDFDEPAYRAGVSRNPEFDTDVLRFSYSSMTTPNSVFDYGMDSRERELKKQDEVLGDFDSDDYRSERMFAVAEDGTRVPVSLVYRKGFQKNGSAPLLLYGYGSYGASMDASFSFDRLSLLDRGFVYAIAHIRGGQEMGRSWYEDGKLFKKKNTFTDFIACAEYLIEEKYADRSRVYAMGGSAGGLLMGAVVNMRPDLWHGVVAAVPFVDVVTTMLDETIPLTTFEYDEWGNPNDKSYYDYMLSYSPYDRVAAMDYPNLLVTTGLHDSQVQYWEPAKWVAKLRSLKTDDNRLLMKCDMEAGHGGVSGRYRRYEHTAFVYAFLIDLAQPEG